MKTDGIHISQAGNAIRWTHYEPAPNSKAPLLIFLHGFKGFKDWGFVPPTGEMFSQNGFRMLAFNFSHNGVGEINDEFTELGKFKENTFSLELEEALEMIILVKEGKLQGVAKANRLGLIGHSRGGGIALLAASQSGGKVDGVCTWAAVSFFARYPQHVIDQWKKDGQLEVRNARTGQVMHLGWGLHADLMENQNGRLDILKAVASSDFPICVIHGSEDEAVPISDAEQLVARAGKDRATCLYLPTGHTFGAKQPWEGASEELKKVWQKSLQFFKDTLRTD